LTAVGLDASGRVVLATHSVFTSGAAVGLRLLLDAPAETSGTGSSLLLDGQDVAMLRAEVPSKQTKKKRRRRRNLMSNSSSFSILPDASFISPPK
jgi:hypothetical protein